jgi:hypothetical protein
VQAHESYPVHLVGHAMWRWLELRLELVDARVAALEGGLRGWLCGERHGSGGGLSSVIWMALSGRWGILMLVVLWCWQLPGRVSEA